MRRFEEIARRAFKRSVIIPFAFLAACSGMPSYEAMFDTSPEAEGTGIFGTGVVRAIVIIAKYQATERQRQIADQRARVAYARLARERSPRQPARRAGDRVSEKKVARKAPAKKLPRYIAVDTEPDARNKGKKAIMLWDTQSQEIVGNAVYDVQAAPRPLETARFEAYSAEYVGVGL